MTVLLKLLAMGCCAGIVYQDLKERMVYWFLFPITGMLLTTIFYKASIGSFYALALVTNTLLVTLIVLILYLVAKYVLKKKFLNHSFGMGDLLFFYAMAVGFPPVTFIVLFIGGIFFSALLFPVLRKKQDMPTVPLAGFLALFVALVLAVSMFVPSPSLYSL